jgi:hypothetical protein
VAGVRVGLTGGSRSHFAEFEVALDVWQRLDDHRQHRGEQRRLDQPA